MFRLNRAPTSTAPLSIATLAPFSPRRILLTFPEETPSGLRSTRYFWQIFSGCLTSMQNAWPALGSASAH